MKSLVVICACFFTLQLSAQNTPIDSDLFKPMRDASGFCVVNGSSKNKDKAIKLQAIDFKNSTSLFYVVKNNDKYGLIDFFGRKEAPCIYDSVVKYDNNLVLWKNKQFDYYSFSRKIHSKVDADSIAYFDFHLYVFQNGLTGMFSPSVFIKPQYKAIRPWKLFYANWDREIETDYYLAVMPNKDLQVLSLQGKELLPNGVKRVNEVGHGIIRFYDEIWKYYLPLKNQIVSSDGNVIIFYSQEVYKKYDSSRTKATLYDTEKGQVYSGVYDDYFPISKEYVAVKKDNEVGLIDAFSRAVVIPLNYDQINEVPTNPNTFRVYKDNMCGLVNTSNELLVPLDYHNVMGTTNDNYYYIVRNNKMGIVEKGGKVLFPTEFRYIVSHGGEDVLLLKDNKWGLANFKGEMISPLKFDDYRFRDLNGQYYYEFKLNDAFELYNSSGKVYPQPYKYSILGNDCIKLYTQDNKIAVLYFNESGELEETYEYTNLNSLQINAKPSFHIGGKPGLELDEFEEHQLTGKFGKRFFAQRGMSVEPIYTITFFKNGNNFSMGELPNETFSRSFVPGINHNAHYHWDYVLHKGGGNFFMNEIVNAYGWGPDSYHLCLANDDKFYVYANSICEQRVNRKDVKLLYAEDIEYEDIRKLTYGTHLTIEPIEKSDISLYEYYAWYNNLGAFETEIDDLIFIMNPKIGVKFHNTEFIVAESSYKLKPDVRDYFDDCQLYETFEFDLETELKISKKKGQGTGQVQRIAFQNPKERPLLPFEGGVQVLPEINSIALESKKDIKAQIHPNYPGFDFVGNSFNMDYKNGVLIQRLSKANYRLIKPDNTILLSDIDSASFIMNGLFLVRKKGEKFFSVYSLVENSIVLNDVVEIVETALRYVQLRIKTNPNIPFVSGSDLTYCSVEGKITAEKPLGVKDPFEQISIKTRTTKTWDLYNARTLESRKFAFNWNIYITDFFVVLYNDSYFYLLDNDLNLIYE